MFSNKTPGKGWQRASVASSNATSAAGHRAPILLTNPKRKQMQLQESTRIYRDNLNLLTKLRDVDLKKRKEDRTYHISSLNIKNRIDTEERIFHENIQIIGRLQSQKSRYSSNEYRNPTVYHVSRRKGLSGKSMTDMNQSGHARTYSSFNRHYDSQQSTGSPAKLVTSQDGYANRLLLYTELLTLRRQLYHLEISQCDSMYYVLLHELATDRTFKLRLVEQTGSHLISLIKNSRISFSTQLIKRHGTFVLSIPFHPFTRNFTFWPLQKKPIFRVSTAPVEDEQDNNNNQDSEDVLRREFEQSQQRDKWRHDSVDSEKSAQQRVSHKNELPSEKKSGTFEQQDSLEGKDYNWEEEQEPDRKPDVHERLYAQPSFSSSHHPQIFEQSQHSTDRNDWANHE